MHGARRTRKAPKSSGFGFADLTNSSPEKQLGVITGVARASEAASSSAPDFITRSPVGSVESSAADGSQTSGNITDDLGQAQSPFSRASTGRLSSRSATSSQTASPNKTSRGPTRTSQAGDEDWENILNDPISPRKSRGKRKGFSVQRDLSQSEMVSPIASAPVASSSVGTPSIRPPRMSLGGSQRSVSFENSALNVPKRERRRKVDTVSIESDEGSSSVVTNKSPIAGTLKSLQKTTAKDAFTLTPPASEDMLPDLTNNDPEPDADVPAFMSGWEGAAGWGDELDLDDDEAVGDAWGVDIPNANALDDATKRGETSGTKFESVTSAATDVPNTESSKTGFTSSALGTQAQSAASAVTKVLSDAVGVIDKDEKKAQTADTLDEHRSNPVVELDAKLVIEAGSDVVSDAADIAKDIPVEDLGTSSAFGAFERWEGQTLAVENAPAGTGGDGSEAGTGSYYELRAEADPWASSFGKAQESTSVPTSSDKILGDKAAERKVDVSETEMENGTSESATTTVDSETAPSKLSGPHEVGEGCANPAGSSSFEYVLGARVPAGRTVTEAHAQTSRALPPSNSETASRRSKQTSLDSDSARNFISDRSGASESFGIFKEVNVVPDVDNFPERKSEQIQTSAEEEQRAGVEFNGAAVSVSESFTSGVDADDQEPIGDRHVVPSNFVDEESRGANDGASNVHKLDSVPHSVNHPEWGPEQSQASAAEEQFAGFESKSPAGSVSEPVTSAAKVDEKQPLSAWNTPASNLVFDESVAVDESSNKAQDCNGAVESEPNEVPVADKQFAGLVSRSETDSVSERMASANLGERQTLSDELAAARNFVDNESVAVSDVASKAQDFDGARESDKHPKWVPEQTQAFGAEDQFSGFEPNSASLPLTEAVACAATVHEKQALSDWYAPANTFAFDESVAFDKTSSKAHELDSVQESYHSQWFTEQTQARGAEEQFSGFEPNSTAFSTSEPVTSAAKIDEEHALSNWSAPAGTFAFDESVVVDEAPPEAQGFDGARESDIYPKRVNEETQAPGLENHFSGFADVSAKDLVTSASKVDEKKALPEWPVAVDEASSKAQDFDVARESDNHPERVSEETQALRARNQFSGFELNRASLTEPVASAAKVDEKQTLSDWYAPASNFALDEPVAVAKTSSKTQDSDGARESDNYPKWGTERTQARGAGNHFSGFDPNRTAVSVSAPVTSAAEDITDLFQVEAMQGASAVSAEEKLALSGSTWDWGGVAHTDTEKGIDNHPHVDDAIRPPDDKESKCLEEGHIATQEKYEAPKPIHDGGDLWKVKQPGLSPRAERRASLSASSAESSGHRNETGAAPIVKSVPPVRATEARGEVQSPPRWPVWPTAAVEKSSSAGENRNNQDADGTADAVTKSFSSSNRVTRSPVVDALAYPGEDMSHVDSAWGQAEATETIPSAVVSAWGEFDVGIEDTKQKSEGEIDGEHDSIWESNSHPLDSETQLKVKGTRSSADVVSPNQVTGDQPAEEAKSEHVAAPENWHRGVVADVLSKHWSSAAATASQHTVHRFEVDDQVCQITQESKVESEPKTVEPEGSIVLPHERNGFGDISRQQKPYNITEHVQTSESMSHDPFEAWAASASAPEPVEWSLTGFAEDEKTESTLNASESIDVGTSVPSVADEYRAKVRPIVTEDEANSSSPYAPTSADMTTETQPNLNTSDMWSTKDVPVASWALSAQNHADTIEDIYSREAESYSMHHSAAVNNGTAELTTTHKQEQFSVNTVCNAAASYSGDLEWSPPAQSHSEVFSSSTMPTSRSAPEYSSNISDRRESVVISERNSEIGVPAQDLTDVELRSQSLPGKHDSQTSSAAGYANQFWADRLRDPIDAPSSVEKHRLSSTFAEHIESRADESVHLQPTRGTEISDFNLSQSAPIGGNIPGYVENSYAPKPGAEHTPVSHSAGIPVGPERQRTSQKASSQNTWAQGLQSPYPPSPANSSPLRSESEIRDAGVDADDSRETDFMSYAPRTTPTLTVLPNPMASRGDDIYDGKMPVRVDDHPYSVSRSIPTPEFSANPTSQPDSKRSTNATSASYGLAHDHGADLWSADYYMPYEQGRENAASGLSVDVSHDELGLSEPQALGTGHAGYKNGATAETATDQVWSGTSIPQSDPYAPFGLAQESAEPFLQSRQNVQAFPDNTFAANIPSSNVSVPADPYSFQFSIMDSSAPEDLLNKRTPRSFVSWGFGGSLCIITPKCAPDTTADSSEPARSILRATTTVCVYDMASVSQDSISEDWTVALETVDALSSPASVADLESYAAMCERLSSYTIGSDKLVAESRSFLWMLLAVLCRSAGNNWLAQFASVLTGPVSVPLFNKQGMSSDEVVKDSPLRLEERNITDQASAACEVERLLCNGSRENAVHVAQRAGLWSLALVISASLNRDIYMQTVSDFARERLSNGAALQTLCLCMSENDDELIRLSTSSDGVKNWKKTVSVLLERAVAAGGGSREMVAIEKIGQALIERRKDFPAAHICFLISGKVKSLGPDVDGGVNLLGGDPTIPAGRPRSCGTVASVVQSMVYEAVYQVEHRKGFLHLLPYRLIVAINLASVGRSQLALQHCEALMASVRTVVEEGRAGNMFTAPFLSNLESLEQRLRLSLGGGQGGGASSAFKSLKASLSSVFKKSGDTLPQPIHAPPPHASIYEKSQTSSSTAVDNIPISTNPLPSTTPIATEASEIKQDTAANTWNQLVSNTINALAPDQGDLSPPVRPRRDASLDSSTFETSFGYGSNPQENLMHMRSASHGDVPSLMPVASAAPAAQFWNSNASSQDAIPVKSQGYPPAGYAEQLHSQSGSGFLGGNLSSGHRQQRSLDESEAHSHSSNALNDMASVPRHRRSSSDITHHESRSSEKPPRPPKRTSAKASTDDDRSGPEAQSSKPAKSWGWKSRLSEKIRSTFLGHSKQAHMGEENKFVFDKEKGRWIIPGEESEDVNDDPPPPPDDETLSSNEMANLLPPSGSYGTFPQQPDSLNDGSWNTAHLGPSMYTTAMAQGQQGNNETPAYAGTGTMSGNDSASMSGYGDNISESSVGSVASAPIPRSTMHYDVQPPVRNKFRASHKLSGRRAYVDTFNTGATTSSVAPIRPPARVTPNSVGSSPAGEVKIFTPAPGRAAQNSSAFSDVRHSASFDDTSSNASVSDMSSSAQNNNVQNSYSNALPSDSGPSHSQSYMSDTSASAPTYGSHRRASEGPRQPHMRA